MAAGSISHIIYNSCSNHYILHHRSVYNGCEGTCGGPQAVGIQVSPVTVKVVQAAYYIFPNLSIFDIKLQAAHGLPISLSYIFWAVSYGAVYTCLTIILASIIFRRREFP